jgi:hypothetical protein
MTNLIRWSVVHSVVQRRAWSQHRRHTETRLHIYFYFISSDPCHNEFSISMMTSGEAHAVLVPNLGKNALAFAVPSLRSDSSLVLFPELLTQYYVKYSIVGPL